MAIYHHYIHIFEEITDENMTSIDYHFQRSG